MENRLYVENKDNFWRDLLVRIALILLFIFLLIWLFPMPKLETFYDRIFAENIKMMKEAAKDYYTVERLPIEIGDKKKMTLREMLDKKMILPFLDRDGNACDFDNSYVEVMMTGIEEYVFKINLSCPTKTDYVIDYFGCYDVCEDDTCEEPEEEMALEYQYYRKTTKNVIDKYTCPTGYTVKGSSCVKGSSIIDKIAANLYCNSGFTYNSVTDSCEKTVSSSTDATKVCPTGYDYNANSNSCLKYIVRNENPVAICTNGTYNPSTGKCVIGSTSTYNATLICDSGTYNSSTGKCVISSSSSYTATPYCTSGTYNTSTGKCVITTPSHYPAVYTCVQGTNNGTSCTITPATTVAAIPKTTATTTKVADSSLVVETKKWSCSVYEYDYIRSNVSTSTFTRTYIGKESRYTCALPSCLTTFYKYDECSAIIVGSCKDGSAYDRVARTCYKNVTTYNTTYSCASGVTPVGDRCPVAAVTTPKVATCPNGGNLLNDTCYVTTTTSTNPAYKCPSGGTLSGTSCLVSSSTTVNPRYTCPSGGSLSNTTCYVSSSTTEPSKLTCTLGTLINNVCKITTIDSKNYSYDCSTGTLSGSKCTSSSTLREQVNYSCPYDYSRTGSDCIKTISTSSIIKGEAVYKSISSQEYKWSREISLNGWTRTGKTREVQVAYTK